MISLPLDKKVVDIINISSGKSFVLRIPIRHRYQFIRKHRFDGMAVD